MVTFDHEKEVLSNQETIDAVKKYRKSGDVAYKDQAFIGNIRLIYKIVSNDFENYKTYFDDLFQVGAIGLLKSIRDFDLSRKNKFSTYAYIKISGEIRQFIRDKLNNKLPKRKQNTLRKYQKLKQTKDSWEEIVEEIDVSEQELTETLNLAHNISIYTEIEEGVTIMDTIGRSNIEVTLFDIKEAYKTLKPIEQKVFKLYFLEGYNQPEIGKKIGYSQGGVAMVVRRIRKKMNDYAIR